ncbi:hypothetical protein SRHO_G00259740 [Serrasalmus rhombeus]
MLIVSSRQTKQWSELELLACGVHSTCTPKERRTARARHCFVVVSASMVQHLLGCYSPGGPGNLANLFFLPKWLSRRIQLFKSGCQKQLGSYLAWWWRWRLAPSHEETKRTQTRGLKQTTAAATRRSLANGNDHSNDQTFFKLFFTARAAGSRAWASRKRGASVRTLTRPERAQPATEVFTARAGQSGGRGAR